MTIRKLCLTILFSAEIYLSLPKNLQTLFIFHTPMRPLACNFAPIKNGCGDFDGIFTIKVSYIENNNMYLISADLIYEELITFQFYSSSENIDYLLNVE